MANVIQYVDPRKRRKSSIFHITLEDGSQVKCQRMDVTAMIFEGLVPLPILAAVQDVINAAKGKGQSDAELLMGLPERQREDIMSIMQRTACKVVIQPVVVMVDDNNQDHLPVSLLSFSELMLIWEQAIVAPAPAVAPAEAATFREGERADAPAPVSDGQDVQPAAEPVAPVEFIHG